MFRRHCAERKGVVAGGLASHGRDLRLAQRSFRERTAMITHPAFPVKEWSIQETKLDLNILAQTESIFALSNGHIGLRGNLDEGEPFGIPGTYLNSVYELRELPYAEIAYGYPESDQTVINV